VVRDKLSGRLLRIAEGEAKLDGEREEILDVGPDEKAAGLDIPEGLRVIARLIEGREIQAG